MATITLPVSKSIGARYLMARYFSGTISSSKHFDDCDDLIAIREALTMLEQSVKTGCHAIIDVHASGTAFRFLASAAASTPGADITLTGTPRLCARPMTPLLNVLKEAGADITPLGSDNTGPYAIKGSQLKGGNYKIKGDVSSQFISSLMLASPTWKGGIDLHFTTPLVSRPYAEMTATMMQKFGIECILSTHGAFVAEGNYDTPDDYEPEADWSAAGFFYEGALIGHFDLSLSGLTSPEESLQGDSQTSLIFNQLGIHTVFRDGDTSLTCSSLPPEYFTADLSHQPDLVPALAVGCAISGILFKFTGVRNLRLKESDRLEALRKELGKLGYTISLGEDEISWDGETFDPEKSEDFLKRTSCVIDTYDDHRIAMSFAMAAFRLGSIRIRHPEVVEKSFADFWNQLRKIGLDCTQNDDIMTVVSLL